MMVTHADERKYPLVSPRVAGKSTKRPETRVDAGDKHNESLGPDQKWSG